MKTMNWMKRVLALATAASLVLGMLTLGVYAAEGEHEAQIGNQTYETMAEAVEALNGMTPGTYNMTLLRDVEIGALTWTTAQYSHFCSADPKSWLLQKAFPTKHNPAFRT